MPSAYTELLQKTLLVTAMLMFVFLMKIAFSNELCHTKDWNVICGFDEQDDCILHAEDNCNQLWFGNQDGIEYDHDFNEDYFTIQLQLQFDTDSDDSTDNGHAGVLWRVTQISTTFEEIVAYYAGINSTGHYEFGIWHNGYMTIMQRAYDDFFQFDTNSNHTLRIQVIKCFYRFYIDNIFFFESIHSEYQQGTIGIQSIGIAATYYSLDYQVSSESTVFHDILSSTDLQHESFECGQSKFQQIETWQFTHYQFTVYNLSKIEFKLRGQLLDKLQLHIFNDAFILIISCEEGLNCDESNANHSMVTIDNMNAGQYFMNIGAPQLPNTEQLSSTLLTYELILDCQIIVSSDTNDENNSDWYYRIFFSNQLLFICILSGIVCCLLCIFPPFLWCYFKRTQQVIDKYHSVPNIEKVHNALGVIISIGTYDRDGVEDGDIRDGFFQDMDVQKDYANLSEIFTLLNYKVMPEHCKTRWTEIEVIEFLRDTVGPEICKCDQYGQLIYDALIVCVTCHGLPNMCVTSDYRTIEKTVIHRIISIKYPKTRTIPRIFLFDSCEGSASRVQSLGLIRAPTINIKEFETQQSEQHSIILQSPSNIHENNPDISKSSHYARQYSKSKGIALKDISSEKDWTTSTKNPGTYCHYISYSYCYIIYIYIYNRLQTGTD